MSGLWWLSPGDPARRTGGFIYNAKMVDEMRVQGQEVHVLRLDAEWPFPPQPTFDAALGTIPDGDVVVADGLMWTGLSASDRAGLTARCRVWVVVHSPLDMEGGGESVAQQECAALREADGWWATSRPTAALMARRLGDSEAHCICPGTEVEPVPGPRDARRLLAVAHLIPRKGHDRLFDALALLQDVDWTLTIVGSDVVDAEWSDALRSRAAHLGIAERLVWRGTLDGGALQVAMSEHGLLVHTARYEAYGMVLTEALASGLPVMSTDSGALDGVESCAIMRLPSSGKAGEWAEILRGWLSDHVQQHRAYDAASTQRWPSWAEQARALAALLARREA